MAVRKITAVVVAVFLLTGCRGLRQTVEVPVYIHDTAYTVKEVHDSTVVERWHNIEAKGDTVYITDEKITVKLRTITDTAYKVVEKPVEVVVNHIKEVEKPLTWWQKTQRGGFWVLLSVVALGLVWLFIRR